MVFIVLVYGRIDGYVEVASPGALGASGHLVEAVAPVKAEQTEHRQIDAHADAGLLVHIEGVILPFVEPALASLQEGEHVDGG